MKGHNRLIQIFCLSLCLYISTLHATIRIGTVFFYPPFVFNTMQGFDIELMTNICQVMNQKCVFVPIKIKTLLEAVESRDVDLAISAISITDERKKNFIFSLPYLLSSGQFLVEDDDSLKTIDDLYGKDIGIVRGGQLGTIYYNYLMNNYSDKINIIPYESSRQLINKFQNHIVIGTFVHQASAQYWAKNSVGLVKTLGQPISLGSGLSIVALPENKNLIQQVNQALLLLQSNGVYVRLYNTYISPEI